MSIGEFPVFSHFRSHFTKQNLKMSRRATFSAKEALRMVFDSDSDDGEMDDGSDMEIGASCFGIIIKK